MKNYYRIEIENLQNGYLVEANWKKPYDGKPDDGLSYNYKNDKFVFTTWDQVQEFVKNNPLEVPPQDPSK